MNQIPYKNINRFVFKIQKYNILNYISVIILYNFVNLNGRAMKLERKTETLFFSHEY